MRSASRNEPSILDQSPPSEDLQSGFIDGLDGVPKRLPCKYLYDARGSELFEEICGLPEYYPTRTESAILGECAAEVAAIVGKGSSLIELGSGSSTKTEVLLDNLPQPAGYVPIDIAREALEQSALRLNAKYPNLKICALCADYTNGLDELPESCRGDNGTRLIFFPGSTIGNFEPAEARDFLARIRRTCGPHGWLLVGSDLKKDPHILERAYNDRRGITAEFNKNVLARANRELDADFDLAAFGHRAVYNAGAGRIEMHLISRQKQSVKVAGRAIIFGNDESIVTEHSYKYTIEEFSRMAECAGYTPERVWVDPRQLFSVHLLRF